MDRAMRTRQIGLLAAASLLWAAGNVQAAEYKIDPDHTSIIFRVGHWHFSRVQGQFRRIRGRFSFDPKKPEASKVYVEVDTASIDTNHKARDDHMRRPVFFDTAKYPRAIFRSTAIPAAPANAPGS